MSDEEKQEEQYAAITAIGLVERELARLTHAGGDSTAIEQLIITKAQLSKDAFRLGGEVAGSKMSKNLIYFLDEADKRRVNEADRILIVLGELRGGQSALQAEFLTVGESLTQLQQDFARLSTEVAHVSAELGRSREHRAKLQAAVDRVEAQMLAPGERERLMTQHDELLNQVVVLETRIAAIEARLAALLPEAR